MGRPSTVSQSPARLPWRVFPWWFLRLYRRPWVFLGTLLVMPLVAVCLWLYAANERLWRGREEQDLLIAARLASRLIEDELTQTRKIEEAIAARPAFLDAIRRHDRTTLVAYLQILLDLTPMIEHAFVRDAHGNLLAQVSADSAGNNHLTTPTGDPGNPHPAWHQPISGVYLRDQASGEKVVGVSSPIRHGQADLGTVQVQYRLHELSRWLEKVRVEPLGFLYVVDHRGLLVAHPFQLLPGQPKDVSRWAPVATDASAHGQIVRFTQGLPRRPWTAAVVSLESYGWRVVAQQPDAAMLKPFRQLVASFLLLVVLLAGFISLLLLRWAHLHHATLRLLAQQAHLLKLSEQRRSQAAIRRAQQEHNT